MCLNARQEKQGGRSCFPETPQHECVWVRERVCLCEEGAGSESKNEQGVRAGDKEKTNKQRRNQLKTCF